MSSEMKKCKITVLKRTVNQDLMDEYLEDSYEGRGPCECFKEGQEFITGAWGTAEELQRLCPWAWADIRKDIVTVAIGGNVPGIKKEGTIITGCRDWFRPVIFKVERLEDD